MTAAFFLLESMESHIEDLQRQQDILQRIDDYTDRRVDFADLVEAHHLVTEEIEKLQEQLRQRRHECSGEEVFEEEEEEEDSPLSFPSKYRLEHVIEDDGVLRPLRREDLYVENNKYVGDAFRVLYGIRKSYRKGDSQ